MASLLPSSFIGSASSTSVHDAISSYRRSQYLAVGSGVASDFEDEDDIEAGPSLSEDEDDQRHAIDNDRTPTTHHGLSWDDFDEEDSAQTPYVLPTKRLAVPPTRRAHEQTPLLRKVSFSVQTPPTAEFADEVSRRPIPRPIIRRQSTSSINQKTASGVHQGGQSTFGQTLFNSVAVLLGIGLLSEPLAFAYAGWGTGIALITFYGLISCYTAKILARIVLADTRLKSYADIGRKAFGPNSTVLVSLVFCMELFGVSVVLVTLFADSLHSVIPTYSSNTYKIWGLVFLIPTVFLPLSLLSYTSILSIFSTLMIVVVVLIDGLSKTEAPGSIWSPAPTSLGIDSYRELGISFGLFMAGFSGHAVLPSLARDMRNPEEFDRMINWAFGIATTTYAVIGCAGYLMFGNGVSDEISMDLLKTPGYSVWLNQASLWMLVISPLTKFAITTQPLNMTIEILLGLDGPDHDNDAEARINAANPCNEVSFKSMYGTIQRVVVTLAACSTSILFPEFSSIMALLGSFAAFMICVIGPISAKVAIEGRCGLFDGSVLFISVVMATWGTAVMVV